jgi:hypothetical protein
MKKRLAVFLTLSMMVIGWTLIYFPNANLANVIVDKEIREEINYGDSKIVFSSDSKYIYGEVYKKGILGWKLTSSSSPAVSDSDHQHIEHGFRTSNINSISIEDQGFLYGYVNENAVKTICFQTDSIEYRFKVNEDFWVIPVNETDLDFIDEQFSIILKNGDEFYYTFNEIE